MTPRLKLTHYRRPYDGIGEGTEGGWEGCQLNDITIQWTWGLAELSWWWAGGLCCGSWWQRWDMNELTIRSELIWMIDGGRRKGTTAEDGDGWQHHCSMGGWVYVSFRKFPEGLRAWSVLVYGVTNGWTHNDLSVIGANAPKNYNLLQRW